MKAKVPNTIDPSRLPTGSRILVFYKSSKQNEANKRIQCEVVDANEHIVTCRRHVRRQPMTVGYKEIRILPTGTLTIELMMEDLNEQRTEDQLVNRNQEDTETPHHAHNANTLVARQHMKQPGATHGTQDTGNQTVNEYDSDAQRNQERSDVPNVTGSKQKYIGDTVTGTSDVTGDAISDRQKVLREIHGAIGQSQVMINKLKCTPSWIPTRALQE